MSLDRSIQYVKGVGPNLAKRLEKLGIKTVLDWLYFFPRTYDDRRNLPKIRQLKQGAVQSCFGAIQSIIESKSSRKMTIVKCVVSDQSGSLIAIWFNQAYLKKLLRPGRLIFLKGKVLYNAFSGEREMHVTEHELIKNNQELKEGINKVIPIYSLVSGLYQYQCRQIAKEVLGKYLSSLKDPLPSALREKLGLMPLIEAVNQIHFPKDATIYKRAKTRVVFDEFFYFQLCLAKKRIQNKAYKSEFQLSYDGELSDAYIKQLPYQLTTAQKESILDIKADVQSGYCMNRLLQGDVGSGKTDVAVMALLFAVQSGFNAAIMAPTEILAEQHYFKFKKQLEPMGINIYFLKGKMRKKEKQDLLERLKTEVGYVVVGTHALIQDGVNISKLAMAVVDEQHRFGVVQRMVLSEKKHRPHALYMTATPIPRSFTLTFFGDLDKSIIDELPPGRKPPQTMACVRQHLMQVFSRCEKELDNKHQIYIVYPLIEESEKLDLQSAVEAYELIKQRIFPQYQVGLIHGRLSTAEKNEVMDKFKKNEIQVLVSTTVIEVGIDVPNANVMIIQDCERFGLSQLHQLRGRIGRGSADSYCFLVCKSEEGLNNRRIKAILDTTDGFKIAEHDLQIRGPGDLLGVRQSGLPEFKIADLVKDEKILMTARSVAFKLIQKDPDLNNSEYQLLKKYSHQHFDHFSKERLN